MAFFDEKSGYSANGEPCTFAERFIAESDKYRVKDFEQMLLRTENTEDKIALLTALARSYTSFLLDVPTSDGTQTGEVVELYEPTVKHILDYYYQAYSLGDMQSFYMHGTLLILFYCSVDEDKYTLGLFELCQCYLKGYDDAKEALQVLIDDGFISGFKTADEILNFFDEI